MKTPRSNPNTPPIVLQERDIFLLESLARYRYLSTSMVHSLIFNNRAKNAVVRRLLKLFSNEYIDRIFNGSLKSNSRGEAIYFLDRKGFDLLVEIRDYKGRFLQKNKYVSPLFLSHTLAVIDFRILFENSIANNPIAEIKKDSWISEHDVADPYAIKKKDKFLLYNELFLSEKKKLVSLYPDSCFILSGKGEYYSYHSLYFVEIDRGTESSTRIIEKIIAYKSFLSQNLHHRYAKLDRFTVLFITSSTKRRNALISNLIDYYSDITNFLFTDYDIIRNKNLVSDKVWLRIKDKEFISLIKQS